MKFVNFSVTLEAFSMIYIALCAFLRYFKTDSFQDLLHDGLNSNFFYSSKRTLLKQFRYINELLRKLNTGDLLVRSCLITEQLEYIIPFF